VTFSDPGFVALVGGEYTPFYDTRAVRDEGRDMPYPPGPAPSIVLGVEEDDDQAVVSVCRVQAWAFTSDEDFRDLPTLDDNGYRARADATRPRGPRSRKRCG
jgi:hypothetical protein